MVWLVYAFFLDGSINLLESIAVFSYYVLCVYICCGRRAIVERQLSRRNGREGISKRVLYRRNCTEGTVEREWYGGDVAADVMEEGEIRSICYRIEPRDCIEANEWGCVTTRITQNRNLGNKH